MKENAAIEIIPVDNGFVVRSTVGDYTVQDMSTSKVFQTFNELTHFLSDHFPHRYEHPIKD